MGHSLAHGLFNQLSRMVLVELEHLNKLADPSPLRLLVLQLGQQLFVDGGPA